MLEGFGELQLVAELVLHSEVAIAPGLSLNLLGDSSPCGLQFGKELIEIRGEDMETNCGGLVAWLVNK